MAEGARNDRSPSNLWTPRVPDWLRSLGMNSWLAIGVAGCVAILAWLFGHSASIMIPLVLAFVTGVVFYPLVERMTRVHVPRWLGALVVLLLLMLIAVCATGLVVLFSQVSTLNGWTFSSTLALLGVYLTINALRGWFIGPSLEMLAGIEGDVWSGRFDFTLLRPINTQFFVSVRQWSWFAVIDLALLIPYLDQIKRQFNRLDFRFLRGDGSAFERADGRRRDPDLHRHDAPIA